MVVTFGSIRLKGVFIEPLPLWRLWQPEPPPISPVEGSHGPWTRLTAEHLLETTVVGHRRHCIRGFLFVGGDTMGGIFHFLGHSDRGIA
jgi:hypothetical protein